MKTSTIKILPVNLLLLAVGLADLFTTLIWLHTGRAIEVNPVMAAVLDAGVPVFIGVKIATLAAFVLTMEWYRHNRSESFAHMVGKITVAAYTGIYTVSFLCVNC